MSVCQHVKLSEQIRPRDTLACCWDVKQPTNKKAQLIAPSCFVQASKAGNESEARECLRASLCAACLEKTLLLSLPSRSRAGLTVCETDRLPS